MVVCVRVFTCRGLGGFLIGSVAAAGRGERRSCRVGLVAAGAAVAATHGD